MDVAMMKVTPLGSGCEVGRSCVVMEFKGHTIMFDCGVHPAHNGFHKLPFFDSVDPSTIDLLLVTHFHMDHCGAVPYFTEHTNFKGRVFMTHPTKAIYRILMHDSVKIGKDDDRLWDEEDLERSMDKIELINYHQVLRHKGIKFWCYNAGHVLGAAMFCVEIAGSRVLYTGDFSRQADRHLLGAETPTEKPHVVIVESTYGVQLHDSREVRERRFTSAVHAIVKRGGRCLIPVFAQGRAQELLLILDAYWRSHQELHGVPIYYASAVAKKCMKIYSTYINMMNNQVRDAHAHGRNPWNFSFISNLSSTATLDDSRPLVIMASPGMLQSGTSRELFERWCPNKLNGLVMPGYSVKGTLAHQLVNSEPQTVKSAAGELLPVHLSIHYVSFSAHSDYAQTSEFIEKCNPLHVVHVHGAEEEMLRLQRELTKTFGKRTSFFAPKNVQPVLLPFKLPKVTDVIGSLARHTPEDGAPISGVCVLKDHKYTLLSPTGLRETTSLTNTTITQRPRFRYSGGARALVRALSRLVAVDEVHGNVVASGQDDGGTWRLQGDVTLTIDAKRQLATLEWDASPIADMIADAASATLLQLQARQLAPELKDEFVRAASQPEAAAGGAGGEASSADDESGRRVSAVLDLLAETYGSIAELPHIKSEGGERKREWQLTVCGSRALLRGDTVPFDVECDNADALDELKQVLARAQRVLEPLRLGALT